MNSNNTGPMPFKPGKPPRDPFIQAILDNPHPFIMMSVGVLGMVLIMIFSINGSSSSVQSSEQAPEEQTATVFDMSVPADTNSEPPAEPEQFQPTTEDNPAVTSITTTSEVPDVLITVPDRISAPQFVPSPDKVYITIIIDDIGNSEPLGARAVALPGAVTYAVLPHTPFGTELAEQAHALHKEVMLHAPMSNLAQMPLGPGGLTDQLSRDEFMTTLEAAIASVPHLQGVNNHMGSELTGQETQMQWVMEAVKKHELYFVDSLTTAGSVAGRIAREQEVPTVTRNVFLDNIATAENIDREFQRLLKVAREKGSAVGIGHPYKETLDYLEMALPTLAEQNIELISASAMIALQKPPATDAL
ncbi:MAG: divergent polysaccharide deacetylase family protein [Gammaproteobacteria bacterium]|nr:divergent polysaccharide deacetylase family protein [Gammaproteobacteria bacterium]